MDAKYKKLLDAKEKQEQSLPAVVTFMRFVDEQSARAERVVQDTKSVAAGTALGPHLVTYSYT